MRSRTGDLVEVRTAGEILATLDANGALDGLPFMPQMFKYCGEQFRVYRRAHKTCDTVNDYRGRRVPDGVHLHLRCDGEAYGGCQAGCLIFWKEAWLKPVTGPAVADGKGRVPAEPEGCPEAAVLAGTLREDESDGSVRYRCQAVTLPEFTVPLPWWEPGQYLEDYRSGNVSLVRMATGFLYAGFFLLYRGIARISWKLGQLICLFYDGFQALRGGCPFPRREGKIPAGRPTPTTTLDLQPGELVRVKTFREIMDTLDTNNKNRGLYFDAEMVPYCGGTYRVRTRLNKFVDEKTGKLVTTKLAAIILEDVICQARYSDCRLFCPRSIFPWWREIWLERV